MSSPRVTAEGIKVAGTGNNWCCGRCGAFLHGGWGFPSAGKRCESCGTQNRPDFSYDSPSERLAHLAVHLERSASKHDSIIMADVAAELRYLVSEVRHTEEVARVVVGGSEPTEFPPTFPPEYATA